MYLADALRDARLRGPAWRRVATGNVVALGLVSLATDVSSEMVTAVLPAYLVLGLHLSFAQYGLLDGIYTGATALTRLLGGWCADRFQARKLVAGLGYGLSASADCAWSPRCSIW
jgi:nitrate/nitrite transporter NarK